MISLVLRPPLLNLFLLSVYTQDTFHKIVGAQVTQLLGLFLKSSSLTDALYLIERILWTSDRDGWTYSPGDNGGIAIRRVTNADAHDLRFDQISARVSTIIEIARETSSDVKSEIFACIIRNWLSQRVGHPLKYNHGVISF